MTRLARLGVAALVCCVALGFASSRPAVAQGFSNNQVYMHVDHPGPGLDGIVWLKRPFYIAGWAFNCNGSKPEISVWMYDPNEPLNGGAFVRVRDVQVYTGGYRSDVAAAYAGTPNCQVSPYAGFYVILPSQPTAGSHAIVVQAWSSGGHWEAGVWKSASAHQTFFAIVR